MRGQYYYKRLGGGGAGGAARTGGRVGGLNKWPRYVVILFCLCSVFFIIYLDRILSTPISNPSPYVAHVNVNQKQWTPVHACDLRKASGNKTDEGQQLLDSMSTVVFYKDGNRLISYNRMLKRVFYYTNVTSYILSVIYSDETVHLVVYNAHPSLHNGYYWCDNGDAAVEEDLFRTKLKVVEESQSLTNYIADLILWKGLTSEAKLVNMTVEAPRLRIDCFRKYEPLLDVISDLKPWLNYRVDFISSFTQDVLHISLKHFVIDQYGVMRMSSLMKSINDIYTLMVLTNFSWDLKQPMPAYMSGDNDVISQTSFTYGLHNTYMVTPSIDKYVCSLPMIWKSSSQFFNPLTDAATQGARRWEILIPGSNFRNSKTFSAIIDNSSKELNCEERECRVFVEDIDQTSCLTLNPLHVNIFPPFYCSHE